MLLLLQCLYLRATPLILILLIVFSALEAPDAVSTAGFSLRAIAHNSVVLRIGILYLFCLRLRLTM